MKIYSNISNLGENGPTQYQWLYQNKIDYAHYYFTGHLLRYSKKIGLYYPNNIENRKIIKKQIIKTNNIKLVARLDDRIPYDVKNFFNIY